MSIAGYDPSGGAGITADLQVFAAHGLYGISAITAQTVQSTMGVAEVLPSNPSWLARTLDCLQADLAPEGVKIGMLATSEIVDTVACYLQATHEVSTLNSKRYIVLDPVAASSSGAQMLTSDALDALLHRLLPTVDWITPNWSELQALSGLPVTSLEAVRIAADRLAHDYAHLHIVVTGGDQERAVDLLRLPGGEAVSFDAPKLEATATHGTGCAFSSALLAHLIHGRDPAQAVAAAKAYVRGAIRNAPTLGHGKGPLNFFWQNQAAIPESSAEA